MTSKAVRLANIKAKLDALDGEIEDLKAAQKALNDTSTKVAYKPDKGNVDNLKGKKYKEETIAEEDYLEELESEIKSYLRKYKHWNYNDEEIQYLFEFSDFCQAEEDDESETDIVKEKEY